MSRATDLLEKVPGLPWEAGDIEPGAVLHNGSVIFRVLSVGNTRDAEAATDLIVYAVNRLPDYETAVEALERLVNTSRVTDFEDESCGVCYGDLEKENFGCEGCDARVLIRRLRESVPA
jgi:hypothetical protein